MAAHRLSSLFYRLKKAVYRKVCVFFVTSYYLRIEIINTTNVANAIINDNASYTLMLIISLSRGKLEFSSDVLSFRLQTMIKVWKMGVLQKNNSLVNTT